MPSPGSGVIKELFVQDGDTVKPGQKLCSIDIGATGGAAAAPPEAPKPAAAAPPPPTPKAEEPTPKPATPPPKPAAPSVPPPAAKPPPPAAPTASMPVAAIKHAQVNTYEKLTYIRRASNNVDGKNMFFSRWKVLKFNYLLRIIHVR